MDRSAVKVTFDERKPLMATIKELDKEINQYLPLLSDRQKEAVLQVIKTFAEEGEQDDVPWHDRSFVEEMDRRTAELENGTSKGYSWEEVKQKARQPVQPTNTNS